MFSSAPTTGDSTKSGQAQHEPYFLLEKTRILWKEKEDGFCLRREAQTLTRSHMKREVWCKGRNIS